MQKQQISKLIPLGEIFITKGVEQEISAFDINNFLMRHLCCDWGDVCDEDWDLNNESAVEDSRVLSSYTGINGKRFWIITDAGHETGYSYLKESVLSKMI